MKQDYGYIQILGFLTGSIDAILCFEVSDEQKLNAIRSAVAHAKHQVNLIETENQFNKEKGDK